MANRIVLNETSYFGWGSREVLVNEINARQFKKALLVTDNTLISAGVAGKVMDTLNASNIPYEVYSEIKPNPTIKNVQDGVAKCKETGADYIIAVGGGSVIDTAKGIAIVMTNPEFSDVRSLVGVADTKNRCLPIIALPTTAGTAAEVTINYVITDEENTVKLVCVDPKDIPVLSIVDTELMAGMPRLTAASTGLDALTHAMEGYITKGAWEMTDMFHLEAIRIIYHNLEKAVEKDQKAMEQMGLAQYIAGMGFSNVGLGIVHSMAHQLGATYDVPHGIACSLFLPYILEWNGVVCPERFRIMGERCFDLDTKNVTDEEAVAMVVKAVRDLETRLGVPQHMSEVGAKEEDFAVLAHKAYVDPCTGGNPREVTEEAIIELFKTSF